jgi:hypothetical protein
MANPTPINAKASAADRRIIVGICIGEVTKESPHMAAAASTAIAGGGIFSSSDVMDTIAKSFNLRDI